MMAGTLISVGFSATMEVVPAGPADPTEIGGGGDGSCAAPGAASAATGMAVFGSFADPKNPSSGQNSCQRLSRAKCLGQAAAKNGVALALALDAASLGVDAFGPEAQYAKLAAGLTLSTGSMI